MKFGDILELGKTTFKEWGEDKAARLGAALAYYTIFAIGPLILITIAVAGLVFGEDAAKGQIVGSLQGILGEDGAKVIQGTLEQAGKNNSGVIGTIIGMISLLLAAAGLFGQLQDALNTIWGVKAKASGIMSMITERLLTFSMVIATGLLMLLSLAVNATLALLKDTAGDALPGGTFIWQIVNYVVTLGLITLVFAVIYKVLPDVDIRWRDVWVGALATAVLFMIGQFALAFYLSVSNPGSAYGAAGALVIVLVWIYYTAQIVFLGAEFTQVYANKYGADLQPSKNAEWVSGEERAKQGMTGEKAHKIKADKAARGEEDKPEEASRIPRFYPRPEREPLPEPPTPVTGFPAARDTATVVGVALIPAAMLWVLQRLVGNSNKA